MQSQYFRPSSRRTSFLSVSLSGSASVAAMELCNLTSGSIVGVGSAAALMISCELMVRDLYGWLCQRSISPHEERASGFAGLLVAAAAITLLVYNVQSTRPELPEAEQNQYSFMPGPRP